jgi:hypothetical protein
MIQGFLLSSRGDDREGALLVKKFTTESYHATLFSFFVPNNSEKEDYWLLWSKDIYRTF